MAFRGSKKGQIQEEIYKSLIELIIVFFVIFLPLYFFATSFTSVEGYERAFIAKDVGLLIDSLYVGQGNITLNYPQNTSRFDINITKDRVIVVDNSKRIFALSNSFIFSQDGIINVIPKKIDAFDSELIVEKNSKEIDIKRKEKTT